MNHKMPSKGRDPMNHNRSIERSQKFRKDVKEAMKLPHLSPMTRVILKKYDQEFDHADRRKNNNGFVLAG